jgi:hypothetical protein
MPLQATSGAASYDAFGGGVPVVPNYIEEVFSTYLYTGTNSTQSIVNGIDLSTKGGMCWFKIRDTATYNHALVDTARGRAYTIGSDITDSQYTSSAGNDLSSFNTNGFTVGPVQQFSAYNRSGNTIVNWTFRKQPKFFDVVTYTGNGAARTIAHNLGATVGSIFIKQTDAAGEDWAVYHRGLPLVAGSLNDNFLRLNTTNASASSTDIWNRTVPTSTVFSVGNHPSTNTNGATYVAYLFAHDAGGFGLTGTDNVISCGSYTGNGGTQTVTLGYEPQWVLIKNSDGGASGTLNWNIIDNMRGMPVGSNDNVLFPNTDGAEVSSQRVAPTATGFTIGSASGNLNDNGAVYIYIAIRRGPMKVPTSGTSVFGLSARTGTGANATVTGSAGVSDAVLVKNRGSAVASLFAARLTGTNYLVTSSDAAQVAAGTTILQANPWDVMDGVKVGTTSTITNASSNTFINYLFDRAPSFFDVVCYTGDGTASRNITHNLNAVPELIILRRRNAVRNWFVYSAAINADRLFLNSAAEAGVGDRSGFLPELPTSTQFTVGGDDSNSSNQPFISYFFATCSGVSKVGSYTGNGSTQTIDCGFGAGGARFVVIKRTDSTGGWYVYDTARGMTVLTDPYLFLNATDAEVATLGSVTTVSTGFALNSTILAAINVSSGSYTFLAIA